MVMIMNIYVKFSSEAIKKIAFQCRVENEFIGKRQEYENKYLLFNGGAGKNLEVVFNG